MSGRLSLLVVVSAATVLIPAIGLADVVLFDDFEDGILDETL